MATPPSAAAAVRCATAAPAPRRAWTKEAATTTASRVWGSLARQTEKAQTARQVGHQRPGAKGEDSCFAWATGTWTLGEFWKGPGSRKDLVFCLFVLFFAPPTY